MVRKICPMIEDDISELSRFLTTGFHTSPEARYAAPDVLRWKYLEPDVPANEKAIYGGAIAPCSYLARDDRGAIIGHLGLSRTVFEGGTFSTWRASIDDPYHRLLGCPSIARLVPA